MPLWVYACSLVLLLLLLAVFPMAVTLRKQEAHARVCTPECVCLLLLTHVSVYDLLSRSALQSEKKNALFLNWGCNELESNRVRQMRESNLRVTVTKCIRWKDAASKTESKCEEMNNLENNWLVFSIIVSYIIHFRSHSIFVAIEKCWVVRSGFSRFESQFSGSLTVTHHYLCSPSLSAVFCLPQIEYSESAVNLFIH